MMATALDIASWVLLTLGGISVLIGGIGALMGAHLMRNLLRRQEYVYVEGSWVLGWNVSPRNLAKRFHARPGRASAFSLEGVSMASSRP